VNVPTTVAMNTLTVDAWAPDVLPLSRRDRALLDAVGAGRCELVHAGPPELRVDGRWFCDQLRGRALLSAGLLAGAAAREAGRARAVLTDAGRAALAAA
jgi:hypothetical protein